MMKFLETLYLTIRGLFEAMFEAGTEYVQNWGHYWAMYREVGLMSDEEIEQMDRAFNEMDELTEFIEENAPDIDLDKIWETCEEMHTKTVLETGFALPVEVLFCTMLKTIVSQIKTEAGDNV